MSNKLFLGCVALCAMPVALNAQTKAEAVRAGQDDSKVVTERTMSPEFIAAQRKGDVAMMTRLLAGTSATVVAPPAGYPVVCPPPNYWQWGYHGTRVGGKIRLVFEQYCGLPQAPEGPKVEGGLVTP